MKLKNIFKISFQCTVALNGEEMTETQKAGDIVVTITRKVENGQLLSVSRTAGASIRLLNPMDNHLLFRLRYHEFSIVQNHRLESTQYQQDFLWEIQHFCLNRQIKNGHLSKRELSIAEVLCTLRQCCFFGNRFKIISIACYLRYLYTEISVCSDLREWIKGPDLNQICFSNFVFSVADDDHQWSFCCHQIPEGLEHTLYLHHSKLFVCQIYILHAIVDSSDEDYFAFSA